ncbi:MAG: adenylate kinase [Paracoccaceae bacterium]|nr:adenylate kinase [Paracoccaceae bacterium]
MSRRVHITGASGTGTSTLARAIASELSTQAFDTDDFYWRPSDPPFQEKRSPPERLGLMGEMFLPRRDWVLSGSLVGWGDPVIPRLTHVIFLTLAPGPRLARLRARERRRYGDEIAAGGALAERFRGFLDWAMSYDDPTFPGRSRRMHEDWLARLDCPVIRLDAALPVAELAPAALDRTGRAA